MFEKCRGERDMIPRSGEKAEHSGRMRHVYLRFLKLQRLKILADTGLDIRNYVTADPSRDSDTLL